jgi:hypothetical protein
MSGAALSVDNRTPCDERVVVRQLRVLSVATATSNAAEQGIRKQNAK